MRIRLLIVAFCVAGCDDALAPPRPGDQFALVSIGGAPVPVVRGAESTIADTLTFRGGLEHELIAEHHVVVESSGTRTASTWQETYHVSSGGGLERRCPINALCADNSKLARLEGDELEISYPNSQMPSERYRRFAR